MPLYWICFLNYAAFPILRGFQGVISLAVRWISLLPIDFIKTRVSLMSALRPEVSLSKRVGKRPSLVMSRLTFFCSPTIVSSRCAIILSATGPSMPRRSLYFVASRNLILWYSVPMRQTSRLVFWSPNLGGVGWSFIVLLRTLHYLR